MNPTHLPPHWQIKKLGEVCEIKNGKNQKNVVDSKGKYPIYGSAGIMGSANKYICDENTTIVGRKGNINKPIFVTTKFWNVDTAFGLSSNIKFLTPKFLYNFCSSFNFNTLDKSTTIPSLAKSDLLKIELPLPPLPEQEAIVAKIESLFADLDAGKNALLAARADIKRYRQSLLKAAFEGKLTDSGQKSLETGQLPEGWKMVKLGEVIKVSSGKGIKINELKGGKYPVYGGNGLNGYHSEYLFKDKKLIIGRVGVKCGVMHITEPNSWISDNALIVNPISKEFNLLFFKHRLQYEDLNRLSVSTAQPVISGASIYKIEFPLPPLPIQEQIVAILEQKFSDCDAIDKVIDQSLADAELMRQSILKEAFEGRLLKMENGKKGREITTTDVHAGLIGKIIDLHCESPKYVEKLNHVKCEKIAHIVENKLGISLDRTPVKDAAGPDDYNHLKKVEHRAKMANWFQVEKLKIGYTYKPLKSIQLAINKFDEILENKKLLEVNQILKDFLPFELEHAELVATIYAGWNNLLLDGLNPTDEEIVYESRENWSKRKLKIDRDKFFKTILWMRNHNYIPEGKGLKVEKPKK